MMEMNGLPVEQTDEGRIISKRGRWSVGDHDRFPGDVIAWPPALDNPSYLENVSNFAEHVDPQPVILAVVDPEEHVRPCAFCSGDKGLIAERGIIDSDYEVRTVDGVLVGYTCHACVSEAPLPPGEYDIEEGDRVSYESDRHSFTGTVTEVFLESGRVTIDPDDRDQSYGVRIERLEVLEE